LAWIKIKGAHITCNVVHDIRFQRHLHVNRSDNVTELPSIDLQYSFGIRRVTYPHCVSTARSGRLERQTTDLRWLSTWLWLLSGRTTVITATSCSRCWNTDACTFSSHHRSRRMECLPAVLPRMWKAVRMSDVHCVHVVTTENTRIPAHTLTYHSWWQRTINTRDVTPNQENLITISMLGTTIVQPGVASVLVDLRDSNIHQRATGRTAFILIAHLPPPVHQRILKT
jgi:hypothetical protein